VSASRGLQSIAAGTGALHNSAGQQRRWQTSAGGRRRGLVEDNSLGFCVGWGLRWWPDGVGFRRRGGLGHSVVWRRDGAGAGVEWCFDNVWVACVFVV
jgi:hypothetical protein